MRRTLLTVALSATAISAAGAQIDPRDTWLTVKTPHFQIHFPAALEEQARRAGASAELAWQQLASELVPPSAVVHVILADNVDFTNGYASVFPNNVIVLYAHPPVDAPALRNYDDWNALVLTHELAHIFHLDRARGLWGGLRKVFGRHPTTFPNAFSPAWVTEGLAVYYESRLTRGGRLEGTYHSMIARAAGASGHLPGLNDLSRASSDFPGGEGVYVYGSILFDYLARERGSESIRRYVEGTAGALPFTGGRVARRAFGTSFESAWKRWRDSVLRLAPAGIEPMPGWRELGGETRVAIFPRWIGDSALVFPATTGRDVPALFTASLDGTIARGGRRNDLDTNVRLADGSVLFAQSEYLDAYTVRNDLFIERDGRQRRLTTNARLSAPDVNRDGEIVAIQAVPASTSVVLVSRDGRTVTPIANGTIDTQFTDPRWSRDGSLIAAARLTRGGFSSIVVMDKRGAIVSSTPPERAVNGSPVWAPDGRELFYTSDRSGSTQLYAWSPGATNASSPLGRRLTNSSSGVFSPDVSPDGRQVAGVVYTAEGYRVGVGPLRGRSLSADAMSSTPRRSATCASCTIAPVLADTATRITTPFKTYSAWESLRPKYWEPLLEQTSDEGTSLGAGSSGADVIGRHSWFGSAVFNTRYREASGIGFYRYAGLGMPLVDIGVDQNWDRGDVFDRSGEVAGDLHRRNRIASARLSAFRPRVRSASSAYASAEVEWRAYRTRPATLIDGLGERFRGTTTLPSVSVGGTWLNTRKPTLSISREDGAVIAASAKQTWKRGDGGGTTRSVVGISNLYRSLDLPGFAHHVVALRGAAAYADSRATSSFSAGGISGNALEFIPGYSIGDQQRPFFVRGFPPSAQRGIRAMGASAEYRAPLFAPSRGLRWIPLFVDRVSGAAFVDAARAYCPASALSTSTACSARDLGNAWMSSAGIELNLDTGIQRDIPFRFRLGVAFPIANGDQYRARSASAYLTAGSSF